MGLPLFSLMRERAASCAAGSPVAMPEAVRNAPSATIGSKNEPKPKSPPLSEQEWFGITTSPTGAVACPQCPGGCLACPEYRGLTRWWCRRLHWWKPWPSPFGELPTVVVRRGHVLHIYPDGTTRLVGLAAAPTVPASVIPPLQGEASPMRETKFEPWRKAAQGGVC